jgi:hypothetical protein
LVLGALVGLAVILAGEITAAILFLVLLPQLAAVLVRLQIQILAMVAPAVMAVLVVVAHSETIQRVAQVRQGKAMQVDEVVQMAGLMLVVAVVVRVALVRTQSEAIKAAMAVLRFCLQYLEHPLITLAVVAVLVLITLILAWVVAHQLLHKKAAALTEIMALQVLLTDLQTREAVLAAKTTQMMELVALVLSSFVMQTLLMTLFLQQALRPSATLAGIRFTVGPDLVQLLSEETYGSLCTT